jgi:peptidyl-prolyl cis-trans isomerase B (cyclophilin B)
MLRMLKTLILKRSFLPLVLLALSFASAQSGRQYNRDYANTKQIFAEIKTHEGVIKVELYFKEAPNTVANFLHLVDSGFYKGLPFHRIIEGFMAQGGDPKGDGTGGPNWKIDNEANNLKHEAGSLSMANAGPNTAGSQFFICHMPQSHLDGRHTIFGKVVSGFDVVTRLERGDPMLDITVTEVK